ncbi:hypothetical protein DFH28DRAFT_899278, partial [Melampsora americana]
KDPAETPAFLISEAPNWSWSQIASVTLRNQQLVEKGDFVKIGDSNDVGQVASIWAPDHQPAGKIVVLLQETCLGEISAFYGMREIVRINCQQWVNIKVRLSSQLSMELVEC